MDTDTRWVSRWALGSILAILVTVLGCLIALAIIYTGVFSENNSNIRDLASARQNLVTTDAHVIALESQITSLQLTLDSANTEISQLNQARNTEVANLKDENASLQQNLDSKNKVIVQRDKDIAVLEGIWKDTVNMLNANRLFVKNSEERLATLDQKENELATYGLNLAKLKVDLQKERENSRLAGNGAWILASVVYRIMEYNPQPLSVRSNLWDGVVKISVSPYPGKPEDDQLLVEWAPNIYQYPIPKNANIHLEVAVN